MEKCVFCGTEAKKQFNPDTGEELPNQRHPYVAVMHRADVPDDAPGTELHTGTNYRDREYVSYPCCRQCWLEPNRHPGAKAHFFERAAARTATVLAGSNDGIGN